MSGKCILVCAGDFTLMPVKKEEEDLVIAVDAGMGYCQLLQLVPDVIIGDFDSASKENLDWAEDWKQQGEMQTERARALIKLPCEKDDTDTMAAIKYGFEKGYTDFRIYGAMGGRMDHYFAKIQALVYIKHHGGVGYLLDGTGMVMIAENEELAFKEGLEGIFSMFSLTAKSRGVTIKGMKYEVEDVTITNDFPIGVSNEFTGEASSVSVKDGTLVCMIQY